MQLRNAMAIRYILGRTLVLPQLMTGADRWWAPHHGLIPGARVKLPSSATCTKYSSCLMSMELPAIGYRRMIYLLVG